MLDDAVLRELKKRAAAAEQPGVDILDRDKLFDLMQGR
jgi:hypothetical protein